MGKKKDLTGQPFGRLVVIREAGKTKDRHICWECECECGNIKIISGQSLRSKLTLSCGCLKAEKARIAHTTHGMYGTPEHVSWIGMLRRCRNKNDAAWEDYGGRGITVCPRWFKFEAFIEDMGERPKGLTIERIDNDLGYYKENCKWATRKEQSRNQRVRKTSETGEKGVRFCKRSNKYQARIWDGYKRVSLGYFTDLEKAKIAREEGELKYWGKQYGR